MDRMRHVAHAMAALALSSLPASGASASERSLGEWRNPSNSVHVRVEPCGRQQMCGVVIWASEKAKADSGRGGTDPLVGAQLFRDFIEEKPGVWRGRVFVPDIAKTFSGTVTVVDSETLRANGCLIGKIGCRSQIWTRLPR